MDALGEKLGFGRRHTPHEPVAHSFPHVPSQMLLVDKAKDPSLVLQNALAVPPNTFHDGQYVICDGRFVFTARVSPQMSPGRLGAGGPQREWAQWPYGKEVRVESFDIFASGQGAQVYLSSIELEIDFFSSRRTDVVFEQGQLIQQFLETFRDQILAPTQMLVMERGGARLRVLVRSTSVVDLEGQREPVHGRRGILVPQTEVSFTKAPNSSLQLKGASRARPNILQPNFQFKSMGIGGLDKQFMTILRRAFVTRMASPQDIERLGITHVKGMLLYGPPGTGKTLIARQIGKMLNAVEPKIVNGPEMLSKYVGASEENIRKLFKDAEDEYRAKGDDSNLHIIIFDELDAVFKQRGSRGDGTGVGDNVVNQLLSKMDGVNQLNNILVIGMTNRRDLIDSALMRPGRFEIQLEIPLPDEEGRRQIFMIHTARMREEKLMAPDVSLDELAALTRNYSGAEIAGVVRAASQTGLTRKTTAGDNSGKVQYDEKRPLIITRDDFLKALDDVRPAFGVSEESLQRAISHGIVQFSSQVTDLLQEGHRLTEAVQASGDSLMSALFYGPPATGKTAVAATVALHSQFPFVKIIAAQDMTGMTEQQKINHIQQVFNDSYRSERSVIVIDDIETIIEWSDVGPRFSNSLAITLRTLIRARPPEDRPLLILGTTSRFDVLERLDMVTLFTKRLYVNSVPTTDSLEPIFQNMQFLDESQRQAVVADIRSRTGSNVLGIGIKTLLSLLALTRASDTPASDFVDEVTEAINTRSGKFNM